jgi:hypothetical protein
MTAMFNNSIEQKCLRDEGQTRPWSTISMSTRVFKVLAWFRNIDSALYL